MSQGMEKLRQSIFRRIGNLIYYIQNDQPDKYEAEVQRLIARIGEAYADRELELPGEAGRFRGASQIAEPENHKFLHRWVNEQVKYGVDKFIGLFHSDSRGRMGGEQVQICTSEEERT